MTSVQKLDKVTTEKLTWKTGSTHVDTTHQQLTLDYWTAAVETTLMTTNQLARQTPKVHTQLDQHVKKECLKTKTDNHCKTRAQHPWLPVDAEDCDWVRSATNWTGRNQRHGYGP